MVLRSTGPHDNYREQVQCNPSVYAAPTSDDFLTNAVTPSSPTEPTRTRTAAYGTQQTTREWNVQLRQRHIQV